MNQSAARPRRRARRPASLADLLRAEGAKPHEPPEGAAGDCAGPGSPTTKQEALAAALYDLAIGGDLAAARLILAYCEGRPAQVQVNIGQRRPSKAYVVVSPDDWPAKASADPEME